MQNLAFNSKTVFSGNVLANKFLCDLAGRLRFVDLGRPGSCHDTRQIRESAFPDALKHFPTELREGAVLPKPKYKLVADERHYDIYQYLIIIYVILSLFY